MRGFVPAAQFSRRLTCEAGVFYRAHEGLRATSVLTIRRSRAVGDDARGVRSIVPVMDEARPIEAVVFDMDGVLIDSEPMWRAVEREVFAGVGIDLAEEDLFATMGVRIADVVERWHATSVVRAEPEAIADEIVERVVVRSGTRERSSRARSQPWTMSGALGLRVALASSSPMSLIQAVLSLDGLAARFDAVVSGEDEDSASPTPRSTCPRLAPSRSQGAVSRRGGLDQRRPSGEVGGDGLHRGARRRRRRPCRRRGGSRARVDRRAGRRHVGEDRGGPGALRLASSADDR